MNARNGERGCSDRNGCRECQNATGCRKRAKIHGIRRHETCVEAEERRWIAYKILRRPRAIDSNERMALSLVFALDGGCRMTLTDVAREFGFTRTATARFVREALKKIGWTKPVDLGRPEVL